MGVWGRGGSTLGALRPKVFVIDTSSQGMLADVSLWQLETARPDGGAFLPSVDKLTEEEFIEGTLANKEILRLIQFEPQKVKERLKEKEKSP